jgi:hypothetical protein
MIPLYGFMEGDTIGLLVLSREGDTVADLAAQLQQSARLRVTRKRNVKVLHNDRVLDMQWTVKEAGLKPLDRIDVAAVRDS